MADQITQFVHSRGMRWILACIAFLMFCMTSAALETGVCGGKQEQEQLRKTLHRTGMLVLKDIKQKDTAGFIKHLDHRGMGFGVDVPFTPVVEIRRQVRLKQGVYCLLFSTSCIAASESGKDFRADPVLSEWKISYAEWLSLNTPYSVEVEIDDEGDRDMCGGLVTVRGRTELKSAPNVLNLLFIYENGMWMLANTPDQAGD